MSSTADEKLTSNTHESLISIQEGTSTEPFNGAGDELPQLQSPWR
jgi:hypothetical protein